jgi:3D (Asp-Asp-Asp) domain-containing protein
MINARLKLKIVFVVITLAVSTLVLQEQRIHELGKETVVLKSDIATANAKIDSVVGVVYNRTDTLNTKIDGLTRIIQDLRTTLEATKQQQQKTTRTLTEISRGGLVMRATAYDLTVASCGKRPSHPEYGITRSGTKAVAGRTVAVDPDTIPLGSKLFIKFPLKYKYLDGYYIAEDTGNEVKDDIIDIFLGEYDPVVDNFGAQQVKVYVLRKGWAKKS